MNKTNPKPQTLTTLEMQKTRANLSRLIDCLLNRIFALNRKAARARWNMVFFLMIFIGFLFGLKVIDWPTWKISFSAFFSALFHLDAMAATNAFADLIINSIGAYLAPQTLRYLPVILLPFLLAWEYAALYLADIFELDHTGISRSFIMRAAFGSRYERIRIREGEIADENRNSPVYQIGGPGLVLVELDSAALFEDADGRPRVIGPTVDKARGFIELTGFERLRSAYDIRNHYTEPLKVGNRSLDGIKIEARDVRLVYSVWRGPGSPEPTLERPYPFDKQAIEHLVYGQVCAVTGGGQPSSCGPWHLALLGSIRSELRGFIARHKLVEFLASINMPEVQKAVEHEHKLAQRTEQLAETDVDVPGAAQQVPIPDGFTPRPEISSMFSRFVDEYTSANLVTPSPFAEKTQKRGVELHWIGVGTWHPPDEIIAEQHLEAWKLSRENMMRGSAFQLNMLNNQAYIRQMLRLVQDVPFESLRQAQKKLQNARDVIKQVVLDYREQLKEALRRAQANAERQSNGN